MAAPAVPFSTWILGAVDPVLIVVAIWLGWRADQAGKIVIAAIAALGASLVADWVMTSIGLPLLAPVSRSAPMLVPVRAVAALVGSGAAYAARQVRDRRVGR